MHAHAHTYTHMAVLTQSPHGLEEMLMCQQRRKRRERLSVGWHKHWGMEVMLQMMDAILLSLRRAVLRKKNKEIKKRIVLRA